MTISSIEQLTLRVSIQRLSSMAKKRVITFGNFKGRNKVERSKTETKNHLKYGLEIELNFFSVIEKEYRLITCE